MSPNSSFTNYGTMHSSNGIHEPTSALTPTLRLGGPSAPALATGTTYVEAGWVLQLGAISFSITPRQDGLPVVNSSRTNNGADNYKGSPGACTAIYIDSDRATASGFNIDGADPQGTLMDLPAML